MANKFSRKSSVFILAFIEGLESASYHGMRTVLLFYILEGNGMNLPVEQAGALLGWLTGLLAILPFLMGLLTDLVFKQEKGIVIGAAISLIGYLWLAVGASDVYSIWYSILLIAVGTSLVRPNVPVLLGRLFGKREKNRDLAFVARYGLSNVGIFSSIMLVGYITEATGWQYGFAATAFFTFLYLLLFVSTRHRITYNEEVEVVESTNYGLEEDDSILDNSILDNPKSFSRKHLFFVILLVSFFIGFFWMCYGGVNSYLVESLRDLDEYALGRTIMIWGVRLLSLVLLIMFLIMYFVRVGSTIFKFSIGMLLLGLATISIFFISNVPIDYIALYVIIPMSLIAIAETMIIPIASSYITRLSSIKYASTTYGFFIGMFFIIPKVIDYFGLHDFHYALEVYTVLMFVVGIAIFVFRKNLRTWTNGID